MNPNEGAPNKKTEYEYIMSQGPDYLALLLTMSKIAAMEACAKNLGYSYKASDELRDKLVLETLERLCSEHDT